jgi:hypothetical protein
MSYQPVPRQRDGMLGGLGRACYRHRRLTLLSWTLGVACRRRSCARTSPRPGPGCRSAPGTSSLSPSLPLSLSPSLSLPPSLPAGGTAGRTAGGVINPKDSRLW